MKVAIVTGAGGGIGRAISWKLMEAGHVLVLAGRTPGPLQELAEEIRRSGGESLVVLTDVSQPAQVDALVQKTLAAYGQIQVLVNNAGYAPMVSTAEVTPEQWREILDKNLSASFYTSRAVWPTFRKQHLEYVSDHRGVALPREVTTGGVIVNISSVAARDPFPCLGAYAVAKLGVNMLTRVLAQEGEAIGVRVSAVAPAGVETPMFRSLVSAEQVPGDEILRPDDVADVVVSLVDGPLRYANGEVIWMHRRL